MRFGRQISFVGILFSGLIIINSACGTKAPELHKQALLARQSGKYQEAKDLLVKALEKQPRNYVYWKDLGNVYLTGFKDLKKASFCYEKSLDINPDYKNARHNIGIIYSKTGAFEKAEVIFLDILKKHPKFHYSYIELANIYIHKKQIDKALKYAIQARELAPDNYMVWYQLALLQIKFKSDYKLGSEYLSKALSLNDNYMPSVLLAAELYEKLQKKRKAYHYYNKYLEHLKSSNEPKATILQYEAKLSKLKP